MKRLFSVLLSVTLLLSVIAGSGMHAAAADLAPSGACGINVTYTFDSATGALSIRGAGNMYDYARPQDSPFYQQTAIKSVAINGGVTGIGNYAFQECALSAVTIPATVTRIGEYAFFNCKNLKTFTLPASVAEIGIEAFDYTGFYRDAKNWENDLLYNSGCLLAAKPSLTGDRTVKQGTRLMAQYAFSECKGLSGVTVPDSVAVIDQGTFSQCTFLNYVNFAYGLTVIGKDAFYDCKALTAVTLPDTVLSVDAGAFSNCRGLKTVTLGAGVTVIGEYAFNCCDALETVVMPLSVRSIGLGAFYPCEKMKDVYYAGSKAQWDKIKIEKSNAPLVKNYHLHCTDDVASLKLKKRKKAFKASWKAVAGATSYEVRYSLRKDFSGAKVVKTKKRTLTVKKLKKGKKYYVSVRAVTAKDKGQWSKPKAIKIK